MIRYRSAAVACALAASLFPLTTVAADAVQAGQAALVSPAERAEGWDAVADALADAGYAGILAASTPGETARIFTTAPSGLDPELRIDAQTQIDIGSIVKTVTGVVVSKLIADGTLSADATIGDYFPGAPADRAAVTLHQLLTHTAGFPGAVAFDLDAVSRDEILALAFDAPLEFSPGEGYAYSNTGFTLAAILAEEATGETYEQLARRLVFDPAGMTATGYLEAYDPERSERSADGRDVMAASWGGHAPGWALIGNGGMVSTAADLLALGHYLRQAVEAGEGWARLMTAPHVDEGGGESFYGYGIVVEDRPGAGRVYWHNGGNPHFMSELAWFADHGLVIATHTNSRTLRTFEAVEAASAAALGQTWRITSPAAETPLDSLPETPEGELVRALLAAFASDDEAVWRAFLDNRASADFVALASPEEHLAFFARAHNDLAEAVIYGFEPVEGGVDLRIGAPGRPVMPATIYMTDEAGGLKFAGIRIG